MLTRRFAVRLAVPLAAGALLGAPGCVLKKPPDAAAIRTEAMPAMAIPPGWTARGADN